MRAKLLHTILVFVLVVSQPLSIGWEPVFDKEKLAPDTKISSLAWTRSQVQSLLTTTAESVAPSWEQVIHSFEKDPEDLAVNLDEVKGLKNIFAERSVEKVVAVQEKVGGDRTAKEYVETLLKLAGAARKRAGRDSSETKIEVLEPTMVVLALLEQAERDLDKKLEGEPGHKDFSARRYEVRNAINVLYLSVSIIYRTFRLTEPSFRYLKGIEPINLDLSKKSVSTSTASASKKSSASPSLPKRIADRRPGAKAPLISVGQVPRFPPFYDVQFDHASVQSLIRRKESEPALALARRIQGESWVGQDEAVQLDGEIGQGLLQQKRFLEFEAFMAQDKVNSPEVKVDLFRLMGLYYVELANDALYQGNKEAARAFFENAVTHYQEGGIESEHYPPSVQALDQAQALFYSVDFDSEPLSVTDQGKLETVVTTLEPLLEEGGSSDTYSFYAQAQWLLQRPSAAVGALQQMMEASPLALDTYVELFRTLALMGLEEEAFQVMERAWQLSGQDLLLLTQLFKLDPNISELMQEGLVARLLAHPEMGPAAVQGFPSLIAQPSFSLYENKVEALLAAVESQGESAGERAADLLRAARAVWEAHPELPTTRAGGFSIDESAAQDGPQAQVLLMEREWEHSYGKVAQDYRLSLELAPYSGREIDLPDSLVQRLGEVVRAEDVEALIAARKAAQANDSIENFLEWARVLKHLYSDINAYNDRFSKKQLVRTERPRMVFYQALLFALMKEAQGRFFKAKKWGRDPMIAWGTEGLENVFFQLGANLYFAHHNEAVCLYPETAAAYWNYITDEYGTPDRRDMSNRYRAIALVSSQNYAEGFALAQKVHGKTDRSGQTYTMVSYMIRALKGMGRFEQARHEVEARLGDGPLGDETRKVALLKAGIWVEEGKRAFLRTGEEGGAFQKGEAFLETFDLEPTDSGALEKAGHLADLLLASNPTDETTLERVVEVLVPFVDERLSLNSPELYARMAQAQFGLGNTLEALQVIRKMMGLFPYHNETYQSLFSLYMQMGWVDEAFAAWQRLYQLSGEQPRFFALFFNQDPRLNQEAQIALVTRLLEDETLAPKASEALVAMAAQPQYRLYERIIRPLLEGAEGEVSDRLLGRFETVWPQLVDPKQKAVQLLAEVDGALERDIPNLQTLLDLPAKITGTEYPLKNEDIKALGAYADAEDVKKFNLLIQFAQGTGVKAVGADASGLAKTLIGVSDNVWSGLSKLDRPEIQRLEMLPLAYTLILVLQKTRAKLLERSDPRKVKRSKVKEEKMKPARLKTNAAIMDDHIKAAYEAFVQVYGNVFENEKQALFYLGHLETIGHAEQTQEGAVLKWWLGNTAGRRDLVELRKRIKKTGASRLPGKVKEVLQFFYTFWAFLYEGNFTAAARMIERNPDLVPDFKAMLPKEKGKRLLLEGKMDESAEAFREALTLLSDEEGDKGHKAEILFALDPTSSDNRESVLDLVSDATLLRFKAEWLEGDRESAWKTLERMVGEAPYSAGTRLGLFEAFALAGLTDQAVEAFRSLYQVSSKDSVYFSFFFRLDPRIFPQREELLALLFTDEELGAAAEAVYKIQLGQPEHQIVEAQARPLLEAVRDGSFPAVARERAERLLGVAEPIWATAGDAPDPGDGDDDGDPKGDDGAAAVTLDWAPLIELMGRFGFDMGQENAPDRTAAPITEPVSDEEVESLTLIKPDLKGQIKNERRALNSNKGINDYLRYEKRLSNAAKQIEAKVSPLKATDTSPEVLVVLREAVLIFVLIEEGVERLRVKSDGLAKKKRGKLPQSISNLERVLSRLYPLIREGWWAHYVEPEVEVGPPWIEEALALTEVEVALEGLSLFEKVNAESIQTLSIEALKEGRRLPPAKEGVAPPDRDAVDAREEADTVIRETRKITFNTVAEAEKLKKFAWIVVQLNNTMPVLDEETSQELFGYANRFFEIYDPIPETKRDDAMKLCNQYMIIIFSRAIAQASILQVNRLIKRGEEEKAFELARKNSERARALLKGRVGDVGASDKKKLLADTYLALAQLDWSMAMVEPGQATAHHDRCATTLDIPQDDWLGDAIRVTYTRFKMELWPKRNGEDPNPYVEPLRGLVEAGHADLSYAIAFYHFVGEHQGVIDQVTAALQADPTRVSVPLLNDLGVALCRSDQPLAALTVFSRAHALAPSEFLPLANLFEVLLDFPEQAQVQERLREDWGRLMRIKDGVDLEVFGRILPKILPLAELNSEVFTQMAERINSDPRLHDPFTRALEGWEGAALPAYEVFSSLKVAQDAEARIERWKGFLADRAKAEQKEKMGDFVVQVAKETEALDRQIGEALVAQSAKEFAAELRELEKPTDGTPAERWREKEDQERTRVPANLWVLGKIWQINRTRDLDQRQRDRLGWLSAAFPRWPTEAPNAATPSFCQKIVDQIGLSASLDQAAFVARAEAIVLAEAAQKAPLLPEARLRELVLGAGKREKTEKKLWDPLVKAQREPFRPYWKGEHVGAVMGEAAKEGWTLSQVGDELVRRACLAYIKPYRAKLGHLFEAEKVDAVVDARVGAMVEMSAIRPELKDKMSDQMIQELLLAWVMHALYMEQYPFLQEEELLGVHDFITLLGDFRSPRKLKAFGPAKVNKKVQTQAIDNFKRFYPYYIGRVDSDDTLEQILFEEDGVELARAALEKASSVRVLKLPAKVTAEKELAAFELVVIGGKSPKVEVRFPEPRSYLRVFPGGKTEVVSREAPVVGTKQRGHVTPRRAEILDLLAGLDSSSLDRVAQVDLPATGQKMNLFSTVGAQKRVLRAKVRIEKRLDVSINWVKVIEAAQKWESKFKVQVRGRRGPVVDQHWVLVPLQDKDEQGVFLSFVFDSDQKNAQLLSMDLLEPYQVFEKFFQFDDRFSNLAKYLYQIIENQAGHENFELLLYPDPDGRGVSVVFCFTNQGGRQNIEIPLPRLYGWFRIKEGTRTVGIKTEEITEQRITEVAQKSSIIFAGDWGDTKDFTFITSLSPPEGQEDFRDQFKTIAVAEEEVVGSPFPAGAEGAHRQPGEYAAADRVQFGGVHLPFEFPLPVAPPLAIETAI